MTAPVHPIKWVKDDSLEHLLKREEKTVKWGVEEIRLNDINFEASRDRQSRLGRVLDEDRSFNIAVGMEANEPFKMICITKVKGVGYCVIAGLHRAHGVKTYVADRDNSYKIKCYVIHSGDQAFIEDLLPSLTNAREGKGLTMDERKLRASDAILTHGGSVPDVAAMYGLSESALDKYLSVTKLRDRLIGLGVNISGTLTKPTNLDILRGLSQNDNILKAVAEMLSRTELSGAEVRAVVRDVKNARTEPHALVAIGEAARVHQSKKSPERSWSHSPRRSNFLRCSSQLLELIKKHNNLVSLQVTTPDDDAFVRERIGELITALQGLVTDTQQQRRRA